MIVPVSRGKSNAFNAVPNAIGKYVQRDFRAVVVRPVLLLCAAVLFAIRLWIWARMPLPNREETGMLACTGGKLRQSHSPDVVASSRGMCAGCELELLATDAQIVSLYFHSRPSRMLTQILCCFHILSFPLPPFMRPRCPSPKLVRLFPPSSSSESSAKSPRLFASTS
jgi:hypothetical protein